jgi:hypothetical protein
MTSLSYRRGFLVAAACIAGALVALPSLHASMGIDPWGWAVWGRELVHGHLDTTLGPAWKPLPVAVLAPLSVFGHSAPYIWLVIVYAASLVALVFGYRVGSRLAGPLAGVVTVVGVALLPVWQLLSASGHSEPVVAAFVLVAIDQHLAGRRRAALIALGLAGLMRPEIWPLLGGYGLLLWRLDTSARAFVAAVLAVVPALWFGPDWIGSGSPLGAAGASRLPVALPLTTVLRRAVDLVTLPTGLAVAVGIGTSLPALLGKRVPVKDGAGAGESPRLAREQVDRLVLTLTLAAGVVIAIVLVMSRARYWGEARFMYPAGALLAVVAGVGAARAAEALRGSQRTRLAIIAVTAAACLPFWYQRAHHGVTEIRLEGRKSNVIGDGLEALVRDYGRRLLGCGAAGTHSLTVAHAAFELHVPMSRLTLLDKPKTRIRRGVAFIPPGLLAADGAALPAAATAHPIRRPDGWTVIGVRCASIGS